MGEENCCNTEEFILVHEEIFKTLWQAINVTPGYIQDLNPINR